MVFLALPGVLLLVSLPGDLIYGYVLWRLWAWFAVPLGVPGLAYPHAVGLLLIAQMLRAPGQVYYVKDDDRTLMNKAIIPMFTQLVLFPALVLFLGWVIHAWWMPGVSL